MGGVGGEEGRGRGHCVAIWLAILQGGGDKIKASIMYPRV